MTILAYCGFDHGAMSVAADGSSPVDAAGVGSWGYPATTISVATGVTGVTTGVVSDTSQAMGKAPKRQPLVIQSTSAAASAGANIVTLGKGLMTGNTVTYNLGLRMKISLSTGATAVNAFVPVIGQAESPTNPVVDPITYNPSTQQLKIGTSLIPFALGTEYYLEFTSNNGNVSVVLNRATYTWAGGRSGYTMIQLSAMAAPMVSGASDYARVAVSDIYIANGSGAAPYNALLGPVAVLDVPFDTATESNALSSPSTDTLVQAMASLTDDSIGQIITTTQGSISMSLASPPKLSAFQVVAAQPVTSAYQDSSYAGVLQLSSAYSGTAAAKTAIAASTTATPYVGAISNVVNAADLANVTATVGTTT